MPAKQKVSGDHVLYHYLQKELLQSDIWLFQMLAARLVASLGIWMKPELYARFPVLVPYAVRDASCRKRKPDGVEQWGSPDERGYFRDDNSLIKNIPSSFKISSPLKEIYDGQFLGTGFVASHIWRTVNQPGALGGSASKNPWTYSFVPNLVWLPAQVAKLTDREGSFTQLYLQALSSKIYRDVPIEPRMKPFVEKSWGNLPTPSGIPVQGLPDISELSFFEETPGFVQKRIDSVKKISAALADIADGKSLRIKIVSTRYTKGLVGVAKKEARELAILLKEYAAAAEI